MRLVFFTESHPKLTALIIAALMIPVPGIWSVATYFFFGPDFNSALPIVVYTAAIQLLLCRFVERFIFVLQPFLMAISGVALSNVTYAIALTGMNGDYGFGAIFYFISAMAVTLFGAEFIGVVFGTAAYWIYLLGRKIYEKIKG